MPSSAIVLNDSVVAFHQCNQLMSLMFLPCCSPCVGQVATKYKTVNMSNAFPPEFLHPLLRMSLLEDAGMRITVQAILHTLIDRHSNTEKLKSIEYAVINCKQWILV